MLIFNNRNLTKKIDDIDERIRNAFSSVKKDIDLMTEELDDHRDVINQHDEEIKEILSLLEKIKDTQEEHSLILGNTHFSGLDMALSNIERRILLSLYTSEFLLTIEELAKKLRLSEKVVTEFIDDLKEKGIPILKQKSLDNKVYLFLDQKFKDLQAKKNFLKLNDSLTKQLLK
ncbi:MAG: HTH domain-containing protein [Candidatus Woesearchaeota archaeon]